MKQNSAHKVIVTNCQSLAYKRTPQTKILYPILKYSLLKKTRSLFVSFFSFKEVKTF